MPRLLFALLFIFSVAVARAQSSIPPQTAGEDIIVSGGVSLMQWEKFKDQPHDRWWLNFINAAKIRIEQIKQADPRADIAWLVYRPNYISRAKQEGQELTGQITAIHRQLGGGVRLYWFSTASELINYLNVGKPRDQIKIRNFEYFGHSNKAAFMFDYSNYIDSSSKSWLHERELGRIRRGIFTRDAHIKSWGCHTAELFSKSWRAATGTKMVGAVGKTQYMTHELPVLSSTAGRWSN